LPASPTTVSFSTNIPVVSVNSQSGTLTTTTLSEPTVVTFVVGPSSTALNGETTVTPYTGQATVAPYTGLAGKLSVSLGLGVAALAVFLL